MIKTCFIACILMVNFAFADCIFCSLSLALDTLEPGRVAATQCTNCYAPQLDSCRTDTFSQSMLLDSLRDGYDNKAYAVFGHVDSVRSIPETLWIEDLVHESVHVAIDLEIKGDWPENGFWFEYRDGCAKMFGSLLNREILLFFDSTQTLSKMNGPNVGIHPGWFAGEEIGYFVVSGRIVKKGLYPWFQPYGIPGVSVDSAYFMDHVIAVEQQRPQTPARRAHLAVWPNPIGPSSRIYLRTAEARPVKIEVFDMQGRRLYVLDDAYRAAGRHVLKWSPEGKGAMVYLIRMTAGNAVETVKGIRLK